MEMRTFLKQFKHSQGNHWLENVVTELFWWANPSLYFPIPSLQKKCLNILNMEELWRHIQWLTCRCVNPFTCATQAQPLPNFWAFKVISIQEIIKSLSFSYLKQSFYWWPLASEVPTRNSSNQFGHAPRPSRLDTMKALQQMDYPMTLQPFH